MALSTELIQRLDADEPLPKRLKLAKNAYCSAELALTRKEDLIISWLCNVAPVSSEAWLTLYLCINSQGPGSRSTIKPEVREKLVKTLSTTLKSGSISDEVLKCCCWVLTNTGMQHYFKDKLKKYTLLVRHLLTSIASSIEDDTNVSERGVSRLGEAHRISINFSKLASNQFDSIVTAVDSVTRLYKQTTEKEEFIEYFLEHILEPLCTVIDPTSTDCTNRIGAEAHKCIQYVLFGKGRYVEYKEGDQTNEKSLPNKLYAALRRLVENGRVDVVPIIFGFIFRAVAGSYKTDTVLLDRMFRNLVNCSGQLKIVVSISMIECLNDIPLEFSNKIDDITLTEFFCNMIDETLVNVQLRSVDYVLLCKITQLNPLIENKLPSVLKRILLERKSNDTENAAYASLMISILDATVRLRREQKIIPWLLQSLKESLTENNKSSFTSNAIFPIDFRAKFTTVVSGLNSSQVTAMLKSLIFHLKVDCAQALDNGSDNSVSLMSECTVDLLVKFLDGIRIFEHSVPLESQKKFVKTFGELGDVISSLSKKILSVEHSKRITIVLLEASLSWSNIHSLLVQYVPKADPAEIIFPIASDDLQQLIQRVTNFGDSECQRAMNHLLLHRIKSSLLKKSKVKLSSLSGGLHNSWPLLLENYSEILRALSLNQTSELASLIVEDLTSNESKSEKFLSEENVQENKILVVAIVCRTLLKIGSLIGDGMTASLITNIDVITTLEEISNDVAISALNEMKITNEAEWSRVVDRDISAIERCLETLLALPLKYLDASSRTLTFVVIHATGKECASNQKIQGLCDDILLETLEEGAMNVFDFIDPTLLIQQLPESKVLPRVFEISLRYVKTSAELKSFIGADTCPSESAAIIFTCIGKVKPKLNNEQKTIFKKIEKKLAKHILGTFSEHMKTPLEIRSLTLALKLAIADNNIKDKHKILARNNLESIFKPDDRENKCTDCDDNSNDYEALIKEGLELAIVVLRRRTDFDLSKEIIANIWKVVLKYPEVKLITPLMEASEPKVFSQLLKSLHDNILEDLKKSNESRLKNSLLIWDCILKIDMGELKNKCRLSAIKNLTQSLQVHEVTVRYWPEMINLLEKMVNSKHLRLSGENIDMIILVGARALREGNLLPCDDVLTLCLALLRSQTGIITDRLPPLLLLYRQTVSIVAHEARKTENEMNRTELGLFALNVEKVTNSLVKLKKDVIRVSPYLIADLVHLFSEGTLQSEVKEPLRKCILDLLSICDPHGVSLLSRALPPATREIFKEIHAAYNKFHRFTGKI